MQQNGKRHLTTNRMGRGVLATPYAEAKYRKCGVLHFSVIQQLACRAILAFAELIVYCLCDTMLDSETAIEGSPIFICCVWSGSGPAVLVSKAAAVQRKVGDRYCRHC